MVICMKTTIEISDALIKQVRKYSQSRGLSLRALVEISLRMFLENSSKPKTKFKLKKHAVNGSGIDPNFSIDGSWDDISEEIYKGR